MYPWWEREQDEKKKQQKRTSGRCRNGLPLPWSGVHKFVKVRKSEKLNEEKSPHHI
jgi:hypothetical protein